VSSVVSAKAEIQSPAMTFTIAVGMKDRKVEATMTPKASTIMLGGASFRAPVVFA